MTTTESEFGHAECDTVELLNGAIFLKFLVWSQQVVDAEKRSRSAYS